MEGRTLVRFVFLLLHITWTSTGKADDEKPRMLSTSNSLNVREGATIVLPCKAVNIDRKVRVWKQLPSRTIFSGTISVSRDPKIDLVEGSLQISDITPEYAGEYICLISHHSYLNVTYKIQVLVPPIIIPDPAHGKAIVRKGSQTTILCNVSGIPKPIVTWTYEHEGVQLSSLPSGVRQVHGTQLQVASVDVHHAGHYKCTADNDVGDPVSANFNVTVLYAPEITVTPEWTHGDEGATVEFACTCNSAPLSQVSWVKGDPSQKRILEPDERVKLREEVYLPGGTKAWLRIQRLRSEDLGSYACVAKNSVGQTWKRVEISGLAEPVQLRGNESGERSFLLLWTVKSYSPIIEYQLKIRKLKSGDDWTDVMIPVSEDGIQQALFFSQSYNVTGLDPGSKYEAVLQAHNDFGWNRPSDTLLFSAGSAPEPEMIEETTILTLLPLYDADLDITDPTYLKQDSSSSSTAASNLLFIFFAVIYLH